MQSRPDKQWNFKLAKGQFDHGRMPNCKFETYEKNGEIKLLKRRD